MNRIAAAAVTRRSFLGGLMALVGGRADGGSREAGPRLPPVPAWRPSFRQPPEEISDRLRYYTDNRQDFVVLRYGTCVVLEPGQGDEAAREFALRTLANILSYHPDMNPTPMDDGNLLVRYNHPAANVVLTRVARAHWAEVESRHRDGLAPDEVLVTPLGPNRFDDAGKMALLGRCYMFMDAQDPVIVAVERV
ncbi:MAG TPA: hypothetical protein VEA60_16085 [Allosphingosinicella sp.]|nr:hypothetical protein [Allosphingosinicella sp.]